jgi:hypothetical protein
MSFELGSPQFSFSYSRISLSDIAKKLSLDSKDPVAKAIRPSLADAASPPACGECVLLGYCSPPSSVCMRGRIGRDDRGQRAFCRILSPLPHPRAAPLVPTRGVWREERQREEVSGGEAAR